MNQQRVVVIGSLVVLLLSPGVHAQLYKWTDANGKVHYSDQAPPTDSKSQKIIAPAPSADPTAIKSLAARQAELRRAQASETEKAAKAEQAAAEEKKRQEACNQARGRLKLIQGGGRVYRFDDKGEKNFVDETGRLKAQQEAEQEVAQLCKPTA